ncbi:hypothetical protein JTB14_032275 [Gonioctena quinquepunctata]|nr:hypothetical protein JTB14_032275 [Gonioctena quinquepunctata]
MLKSSSVLRCGCGASLRRFYGVACPNIQILSDMIGVPRVKAKQYIDKYKLQNKNGENLIQNIKFCQNLGYSNEEILVTPHLLSNHPVELEQHYLSMEEGGFQPIGPKILAKARTLMKRSVSVLKSDKLILDSTKVSEKLVSYIEDEKLKKYLPLDFTDDDMWNNIHFRILQSFLRLKLEATQDDIIKLFRIHKMIRNKSLRVIQENIKIAEDLGFDHNRIVRYGYLLHNHPTYTKTTLRDIPDLAGMDMRKAMKQYPKLIMTPTKNIIKIYGILKEFNIPDETISNQANIFHMSPETVRYRLEEIEKSPDLRVLLCHPRILKLVVHHNRAKSRLSFLQQLQLKCASLYVLKTDTNEQFEEYVKEGKDINKIWDVLFFLKDLFTMDVNSIRKQLKRHPYHLQVPLKDMKDTYDFLKEMRFRQSSIFNVLHVLLYPVEKVQNALNQVRKDKNIKFNSLNQVTKLNLMVYLMEKEHHFTGNGIWRNSDCLEVPEKTLE